MPLRLYRRKGSRNLFARGTINGHRYDESTGTSSRPHAEAWRQKREREILDGSYLGEAAAVFATAATIYMEKGGERRYLTPLIERFGTWRLAEITPEAVSTAASEIYGHCQPATVKRQLYTPLNAVMRAAHRAKLGPLVAFEAPKVERKAVEYPDEPWFVAFYRECAARRDSFRIASMVMFLTSTGARVTEACNLEPRDVNIDERFGVLRMTKSGKGRRLPLSDGCADVVAAAIEHCAAEIDGDVRVFGYASRYSVNQAIERICQAAGIRYYSSHKLGRHAFAARLLSEGASLQTVRAAGGWATIQIVSEVYGHLEQQAIDDAVRGSRVTAPALPKPRGEP